MAAEGGELELLSYRVLGNIRAMQQQHGLRSYDYQRYRAYCARRLERLHKVLQWTHRPGKRFVSKRVEPEDCADPRFLELMLLLAERAWAYGEELKVSAAQNDSLKQARHGARKMVKAAGHADAMVETASYVCDARTLDEMKAYRDEMHGHSHFGRKSWAEAQERFGKARAAYSELAKGQDAEVRAVYAARASAIDQSIRFCIHKQGGDPSRWQPPDDCGDQPAGALTFLGRQIPVNSDKVRALVGQAEQAAQEVQRLRDQLQQLTSSAEGEEEQQSWRRRSRKKRDFALPGALNKIVDMYDRVFIALNDGISQVTADLAQERGSEGEHMLLSALKYKLVSHTLERNLLMCSVHTTRYNAQEQEGAGGGGKPATPFDLVRLHDTVRNTLDELLAIPGVEDADEGTKLSAQLHLHSGLKAFFQGEAFRTMCSDAPHAEVMYTAATGCFDDAAREGGATEDVEAARRQLRTARCINRANASWGKRKAESDLADSMKRARIGDAPATLDPASYTAAPSIAPLPPDFESMPCRPILLDVGLELLPQASIDHRATEAKDRRGRQQQKPQTQQQQPQEPAPADDSSGPPGEPEGPGGEGGKKGWFGGWGWGQKK
eukprot:Hpha_TRINITY_DN13614_c0_g1::TRINITY_DN13614_c0_g1_i1::g.122533::m.122533/K03107/SRP68; signal recognition particle subunit SRP68